MSIIHEALKRKERLEGGDDSVSARGSASGRRSGAAFWQESWFPGALAASGVLLAATLTYLITRPGEITVVLPPPPQPPSTSIAAAPGTPGTSAGSPEPAPSPQPLDVPPGYTFQPAYPGATPYLGNHTATAGTSAPPGTANAGGNGPGSPSGNPAGIPLLPAVPGSASDPRSGYQSGTATAEPATSLPAATTSSNEYPHIPVYGAIPGITPGLPAPASPSATSASTSNAGSLAAGASSTGSPGPELPPNAVTIEMSQGRLESFSGGVSVNSTVPRPGTPIRVGTVISTQPGAAATLAFENAQVDVSGASTARVSRLERRSDPTGSSREEVTVHLSTGNARTMVRPGGGQVLISTDQLTAAASSGAFQVHARPDGTVTVQSEGGQVRLIPRSGEPMTLSVGQQATWRNGAWE